MIFSILLVSSIGLARVAAVSKVDTCEADPTLPQGSQVEMTFTNTSSTVKTADGTVTKVQPSVVQEKSVISTEAK
jgi:hypothetical protein